VKLSNALRFLLPALVLIPSVVFAAGGLKGVVVDSLTREPLVGAHVLIVGTSFGGATDLGGGYAVRSVPPGQYTVKCSYVGYIPKERRVTIEEDATVELNFSLHPTVVEGSEVVITGQAVGQAAAINQQLTSHKIVNVISEQKIKELPDANAAEAIGRLPGVSVTRSGGEASKIILRGLSENLTTITVDGVQLSPTDADSRGIDLSAIPQGSLAGITLTKAITADMDGQAIAGNVNFVTKTAPETRSVQVTAQGLYGALDKTYDQYNFYGNYGERFFDNLLGVQVFGNIEHRNRSNENYTVAYDQTLLNNTDYQINDFTIQYVPEIRKRRGGKLLLDFRTPDDGVIKFNADFNRTERQLSILSRDYPTAWASVAYNFTGQELNTDILSLSLQGQNNVAGWQGNWNLSFTQSETDVPYNYTMEFEEASTTDAAGNVLSGMKTVPVSFRKGPFEALIPYATNNFSASYIKYGHIRTSQSLDFQRTANLDIKKDYTLFDLGGQVQFGGKYTMHFHRRNSSYVFSPYYNGSQTRSAMRLPDGSIVTKDWAAYGFANLQKNAGLILMTNFVTNSKRDIYQKYNLNPVLDGNRIRSWYDISINGVDPNSKAKEYSDGTAEVGTDYSASEAITSGYLMNTLNLGNLATFIAGVRIEADDNSYGALYTPEVLSDVAKFRDTSSAHIESMVLPNFHLILRPLDFMNIRLAAFKGITRPDFNTRLPTYVLAGIAPYLSTPLVKIGNTDLKNADAWNYELNLQFFGEKIGLLSLSGFYKEINNQVEFLSGIQVFPGSRLPDSLGITFRTGQRPFVNTYNLFYPYNSPKPTRVWGFEIEQQTNFRFLPGFLSGLTLTYNLSVVRNETYTPYAKIVYDTTFVGPFPFPKPRVELVEEKGRIVNSPELFGNIVLGYDIDGFSARLSYFYQGTYYNGYSSDRRSNAIQKEFSRLDLALKQMLTENLSVGVNLNNLTNTTEGTSLENMFTGWNLETSSIKYGVTGDLWVRYTL
jgi:TonB-dependent receptor